MCGLAGAVFTEGTLVGRRELIEEMTDVLYHRGPDDKGYFVSEKAILGHRRLSIIDLSSHARQPMFNEDSTLALVFNGEIYNYKELSVHLKSKGHIFRSNSDSEVIVHLYEEHGVHCTQYLEGMFAFAIYDIRTGALYLARDRVGEKPLYYFKDKDGFYFASEIKSFFCLGRRSNKVSQAGVWSYFNYIQIPAPMTIFEGVKKLNPAHWLFLQQGEEEAIEPYWHVDCTHKKYVLMPEAKDELKCLLQDTMRKMLASDVPVGIMLSGGVDSSLLLALAKEMGGDVTTFTVGNASSSVSDHEYIRAQKVARMFNVENHTYDFGCADFQELVTAASFCDEPIGLLEIFYIFGVFGKIKEHVKVVLTGNGADEIFGGYSTYNAVRKLDVCTKWLSPVIRHNNGLCNRIAASAFVRRNSMVSTSLFSHEFNQHRRDDLIVNLLKEAMSVVHYDNVFDAKLFMDLLVLCNHGISAIPDTAGMTNSIELRSPFLHHKIIEFAASLPSELKAKTISNPLHNKYILKVLMQDYFQEEDIYIRKYGFGFFIKTYELMKTKWRSDVESSIFDPLVRDSGIFNMLQVKVLWDRFLNGGLNLSSSLLFAKYVMFCIWYKYSYCTRHKAPFVSVK